MDTLHWTTEFLLRKGLDPQLVQWIALVVDLLLLLLISLVADFFCTTYHTERHPWRC